MCFIFLCCLLIIKTFIIVIVYYNKLNHQLWKKYNPPPFRTMMLNSFCKIPIDNVIINIKLVLSNYIPRIFITVIAFFRKLVIFDFIIAVNCSIDP